MVDFSSGTWRSLVDGTEYSAIPDSVVHQYNAQNISASDGDRISSWTDSVGSQDLTDGAGVDYQANGINGNPSLFADGSDDALGRNSWGIGYTQPFSFSGVFQLQTTGSAQIFIGFDDSGGNSLIQEAAENANSDIGMFAGSVLGNGAADTSTHYFVFVHDGSNSVLNVDGTEYTGDAGNANIDGSGSMRLFADADGTGSTFNSNILIGEVDIHDEKLDSTQRSDEISRLQSEWS